MRWGTRDGYENNVFPHCVPDEYSSLLRSLLSPISTCLGKAPLVWWFSPSWSFWRYVEPGLYSEGDHSMSSSPSIPLSERLRVPILNGLSVFRNSTPRALIKRPLCKSTIYGWSVTSRPNRSIITFIWRNFPFELWLQFATSLWRLPELKCSEKWS